MEQAPNDTYELSYRQSHGLEVFLMWHKEANILSLIMGEPDGTTNEFSVPNNKGNEAFYHPYVYKPNEKAGD